MGSMTRELSMRFLTGKITALFLCLSSSFLLASERPVYTVGIEEMDHLPFVQGREGEATGYAIELLRLFAEDQGVEFHFVTMPIKRLSKSLVNGSIDFRFPDNIEWDVLEKAGTPVAYSDKVVPFVDGYLVSNSVDKLEPGARVGIIRGFDVAPDWLKMLDSLGLVYLETSGYEGLFSMMEQKRVDAVYANIGIINWRTRSWPDDQKFSFYIGLPSLSGHYRLSSTNHVDLIQQFDAFLAANTSLISKLQEKWKINRITESQLMGVMP